MAGHFQLDVQPELVRAVHRTYASIASALKHEAGQVTGTPHEIGDDWTGQAATKVKGDMTALGGLLTTFHGHFDTAAKALTTLARAYDQGLEDLHSLNQQWSKATSTCADALDAYDRQQDQDVRDLTQDGRRSSRFEHEELADIYADKRSGATAARDKEYGRLGTEYDHLVSRLRTATATAGRALRDATHVKVPAGVAVNLHDPAAYAAALAAVKDAAEDALGDDLGLVSERDARDDVEKITDADRLHDLLAKSSLADQGSYDALLAMLRKYDGDPEFAGLLASRLDPTFLARALAQMQGFDEQYGVPPGRSQDQWDQEYLELVKRVGSAYGLAPPVTGDYAPPKSRLDDFYDVITDPVTIEDMPEQVPGQNVALASLLSQGSWDPSFASGLTAKVLDFERHELGDHGWENFDYGTRGDVLTPHGYSGDPLQTLMAGLAQNRAAVQQLLTEGGTRDLTVDCTQVQVSDRLAYLLMERHWNDGGLTIKAALTMGMSDFPGDQVPQRLRGQLQSIVDYAEEQQAAAEAEAKAHEKPWFVDVGHFVLDLAGLIPVVGDVADLINAGWYTSEGDYLNAGLSGAAAVPFLGWAATGGKGLKGVKALFKADEFAKMEGELKALEDAGNTLIPGMLKGRPMVEVDFKDAEALAAALKTPKPNMVYRHGDLVFYTDEAGTVIVEGGGSMRRFMQVTRQVAPGTDLKFWGHRFTMLEDGTMEIVKVAPYKPIWGHGEAFNAANWHRYTHNEVYLANGRRLDSYDPKQWIVERKLRQYAELKDPTMLRKDVDLVVQQYPPGTVVPRTRGNLEHFPDIAGKPLRGRMLLEIPPQKLPLDPELLQYAADMKVTIRDSAGRIYTPQYPHGKLP
ncbi:MAG: hypothetical protein HOQ22_16310 [Nocardioidaceae bacterium]|nr:hypothetical protein [Nocardioidaceae bacterium]